MMGGGGADRRPNRGQSSPRAARHLLLCAAVVTVATAPPAPAQALTYSLERCIATALEHSRLVRDAELDLDAADQRVREAWSSVYPTIDGLATYTRNLTDDEVFLPAIIFDPQAPVDEFIAINFSADNNWVASVTLDQPLFQPEVFIGVGAARRFRALSEEQLRGQQQIVATRARTAYYDLLLAEESARLTEESIRRVSSTLDEARAMLRAGLTSDYDVLRIEVELGNLTPNLRRAQNAVDRARRTLNVVIGIDVDTPIVIEGALRGMDVQEVAANDQANAAILRLAGVPPESIVDPGAVWVLARSARTDLRQSDLTGQLRHAQLSAERASYYPRLFAFGSYRLVAQENGGLDFFGENERDRTMNWRAGLRLELPIFQGFGRPARVARRKLEVEKVETRAVELEEVARGQVRTFLEQLDEARLRAIAQQRAVASAERGFEIASVEFREGTGSQLQVTDAEVALRASEFNYALAVYDYLTARANLDLAAGVVPVVPETQHALEAKEQQP